MSLYTLVDWSIVVGVFGLLAAGIGLAVGWVFSLTHRVVQLEGFAQEVTYELLAKEQAHDIQLMRDRMDRIEYELDSLGENSGQAAA